MTSEILRKLYEYNDWANLRLIEACSLLTEEQLDAVPNSSTNGTIRVTLWHLMAAQQRYVWRLTGEEPRFNWQGPPNFEELREAAVTTGERLRALAEGEPRATLKTQFEGIDRLVEPWVVMLQSVYHCGEHREQVKSMLSALDITPPDIEGWTYGATTGALREAPQTRGT